jgi:hypothetical protein
MMKNYLTKFTYYALVVLVAVGLSTSCSDDDDNTDIDPGELVLKGELTNEKTLEAGKTYELVGGYEVKSGGNLIIQEGVTIKATRTIGGQPDYILVEQGGKITANGTKDKPIVMTSTKQEPGAWGGLHICGKAPINLSGGTGISEIGDAPFGGTIPNDNSGVLRYVRLEYTGFAFSETKESNGLTMYGVGNGTTIEYVQTYKGADDGFEWFGGTVNAKYLVSTHSEDDSFDWTDGWVGKGQFWVAIQDQTAPSGDGTANGDCLIEADNREDNFGNTPVSSPTLANITLVGNKDTNKQKRGIRLRAGTHVKLHNTLVVGKPNSVTTATAETEQSFVDGNSVIEYLYADNGFTYENGTALALDTKEGNGVNQTISFTNGYVGVIDGGKDLSSDSFFTKVTYKGAVPADNDWTAGWTKK